MISRLLKPLLLCKSSRQPTWRPGMHSSWLALQLYRYLWCLSHRGKLGLEYFKQACVMTKLPAAPFHWRLSCWAPSAAMASQSIGGAIALNFLSVTNRFVARFSRLRASEAMSCSVGCKQHKRIREIALLSRRREEDIALLQNGNQKSSLWRSPQRFRSCALGPCSCPDDEPSKH